MSRLLSATPRALRALVVAAAVLIFVATQTALVNAESFILTYIYFTDGGDSGPVPDGAGKIKRVTMIATPVVEPTLHTIPGSSRPRGIAIDQQNGHIYWNLWGTLAPSVTFGMTERSNLDGTNVTQIGPDQAQQGLNDIALDIANQHVYMTLGGFGFPSKVYGGSTLTATVGWT